MPETEGHSRRSHYEFETMKGVMCNQYRKHKYSGSSFVSYGWTGMFACSTVLVIAEKILIHLKTNRHIIGNGTLIQLLEDIERHVDIQYANVISLAILIT